MSRLFLNWMLGQLAGKHWMLNTKVSVSTVCTPIQQSLEFTMTAESICKSGRRLISSDQPQNTFTCPIQEKTSRLGFSLEIHRHGCGNGPCTGSLPVKIGMLHSRNWHHTPARNRKTERWDHGIPNPFSPLSRPRAPSLAQFLGFTTTCFWHLRQGEHRLGSRTEHTDSYSQQQWRPNHSPKSWRLWQQNWGIIGSNNCLIILVSKSSTGVVPCIHGFKVWSHTGTNESLKEMLLLDPFSIYENAAQNRHQQVSVCFARSMRAPSLGLLARCREYLKYLMVGNWWATSYC